ncbi:MAG: hypothetical protein HY268_05695 [Deltaproteobacteria bacterium]|nr:hypothetical protein [Deltaproteobacteria bacterium]
MAKRKVITREAGGDKERQTSYPSISIIRLSSLLLVSAALAGLLVGREAGSQSSAEQESSAREEQRVEEQGRAIVARHKPELLQVPGVNAVLPVPIEGQIFVEVFVYTNDKGEKPATLPPAILALPPALEGLPLWVHVQYVMPPPRGVLILKPGLEYEQAESCPPGYYETQEKGWRFCNSHRDPQPIPGILMGPPIAGIPIKEALKIVERNRAELMALPGVGVVGIGDTGISIEADDPAVLPTEVEGLPLEIRPRPKGIIPLQSHTTTTPVRPVGGALSIRIGAGTGTLAGVRCSRVQLTDFPVALPQHLRHFQVLCVKP